MACFERASPAVKEILLKIHRADRPMEIDQHVHEFGSIHYHLRCSASDPTYTYLSVSTPLLSQSLPLSSLLPQYSLDMVRQICPQVIETVEPPEEGYQLTLKLNFSKIPHGKVSTKIITDISSVQAVILSSQLKDILKKVDSHENSQETYKPIKLIYHPREPFFIIKQPMKTTAIFPMRFKENEDVIIATAFFQELHDIGSSEAYPKAPHCTWSPIPPLELRGEPIEDLSTNCGFVSFGKKLDKTVWNLLNFYALVKYHVKSTRGFIQRRMRTRLERLVQHLEDVEIEEDQPKKKKARGWKRLRKWIRASKTKILKRKYDLTNKIKRIRSRIKIHFFSRFRRGWLRMPKFSPVTSRNKRSSKGSYLKQDNQYFCDNSYAIGAKMGGHADWPIPTPTGLGLHWLNVGSSPFLSSHSASQSLRRGKCTVKCRQIRRYEKIRVRSPVPDGLKAVRTPVPDGP
ncbi:actin-related protein 2/3 complex subunit [Striga asiatica]|uniref:Actin-related protein 2/3 complex subunit n=1 Tax=Striga asiatica TaxID=4170 RepID=A0A5A7QP69_STRAF|nr:actin-related protein 2/3 complex subunit [Striga asiatica]